MIEYINQEVQIKIASLVEEIATQERIISAEKDKHPSDRNVIKNAENNIQRFCAEIYKQAESSVAFLYLKANDLSASDAFRTIWQNAYREVFDIDQTVGGISLLNLGLNRPPLVDLNGFPDFTFTIEIKFTLAKPYMSKNDNDFYILDNPIQRDKVFQVPMMRSSGWKGSLSAAIYQSGCLPEDPRWKRLFGEVNDEDDAVGKAGRLHIYPSFFFSTSLELINPHDRKTKAGKNPIMFETVKQGSESTFSLMYFPFDRIGQDFEETKSQVAEDIKILLPGLGAMFTVYGFGAKTSSGYGVAKDTCDLTIRLKGKPEKLVTSSFTDLKSAELIESVLGIF